MPRGFTAWCDAVTAFRPGFWAIALIVVFLSSPFDADELVIEVSGVHERMAENAHAHLDRDDANPG